MKELSAGDAERVEEVRKWMDAGTKVAQARDRLKALGLNDYHVAFLLEEATGQSFVPGKPVVLIDVSQIKIIGVAAVALVAVLALAWLLFPR